MTTRKDTNTVLSLQRSFALYLRTLNRSERTVSIYTDAATRFDDWVAQDHEGGSAVEAITSEDVAGFIRHRLASVKASTANQDFRSLQAFFGWCVRDGIIEHDPTASLKAPRVPPKRVEPLTGDERQRLLDACAGPEFADTRDLAILSVFIDGGCRLAEVAGLSTEDVDLDTYTLTVIGKGSKPRLVTFGNKTALALDRYMRRRSRTRYGNADALWLGKYGPMTRSGISQVVADRSVKAGLGRVNPHRLRHSWASEMLSSGMPEGTVMTLGGWKSRQMLDHYSAATKEQRALEAYKGRSPIDRLSKTR